MHSYKVEALYHLDSRHCGEIPTTRTCAPPLPDVLKHLPQQSLSCIGNVQRKDHSIGFVHKPRSTLARIRSSQAPFDTRKDPELTSPIRSTQGSGAGRPVRPTQGSGAGKPHSILARIRSKPQPTLARIRSKPQTDPRKDQEQAPDRPSQGSGASPRPTLARIRSKPQTDPRKDQE